MNISNNLKKAYIENIKASPLKVLLEEKIFVCFDERKKPYNPNTAQGAKCNDNSTWGTFDDAARLYVSDPKMYGIGLEFSSLSNGKKLAGIDIDACIDEDGNISAEAFDLIKAVDSYTEYSPRGKGIHILFFMDNNAERMCNKFNISETGYSVNSIDSWCSHIEFYNASHYFTITGKEVDYERN